MCNKNDDAIPKAILSLTLMFATPLAIGLVLVLIAAILDVTGIWGFNQPF